MPATAANGTMYCTTPLAVAPDPGNTPASNGPMIDPMRLPQGLVARRF